MDFLVQDLENIVENYVIDKKFSAQNNKKVKCSKILEKNYVLHCMKRGEFYLSFWPYVLHNPIHLFTLDVT